MTVARRTLFFVPLLAISSARAEARRPLRIGYIVNGPQRTIFEEQFELGLRDNGYEPGRDALIDYRHHLRPDQDISREIGAFVDAKVDAILVSTRTAALAAKAATMSIPVIFGATRDAVQDGLVTNLTRPEANLTGQSFHAGELSAKRVQIMHEAFPGAGTFGAIWNLHYPSPLQIAEAKRAETALGIRLLALGVSVPDGVEDALRRMKVEGAAAVFVVSDVSTITNRQRIGDAAAAVGMPLMMSNKRYLTGHNLMSYGPDISEGFRRAARQLVRAANGTPISELPVEQPTRFDLIIDMRAAKALGVRLPDTLLARADEVIE
jgi:putative ABC transport system substrate-binding protein